MESRYKSRKQLVKFLYDRKYTKTMWKELSANDELIDHNALEAEIAWLAEIASSALEADSAQLAVSALVAESAVKE
jgi:hypothetical protein